SSLVVTSSSQSALVALTYQGEIVATGLIQGGTCTLTFSALNVSGNLLLTLTNFNTIPYQAAIPVQPLTGATIVENAHAFHDLSGGNNNGQADYSETIAVDITLQNTGNITATNVTGVLTSGDQYVSIVDGTHNFGNIAAGVNINGSGAFTFLVDNVVPDQHIAEFTVTYSDNSGNTWTSTFEVTLNAPVLSCTGNYAINDGNNGRLDSGDNATVVISVVNNGHAATSANTSATLSSTSSYITISGSPDLLGTLAPGATVQASFQILVSGATPTAETAGFDFDLTANYYATECSFEEVVNQIMEDWETGDASQFNWQFSGNSDWFVTSTNPFEGNFCMQSGDIGNNQSTTLEIIADFTEDGTVSFARKTSCESSYDFLKFRINGVNVGSWSGEQAWDVVSFPVSSGSQTLTWVYLKDDVASFGTDAAWIDDITLPAYESLSITEAPSNRNIPFIFPNPVSDKAWINIHPAQSSNINISLIDYTGRIVRMLPKGFVSAGKQRMEIDLTGLASGTYFIQVQMGEERLSEKIIKH
ncbi:MAG: T9SS type A sorting domain-containing protein, partial [Crocinitomicaceae bacterium]|nr:T9SS type A sorting domain-containing protein [Crocinitomicaceae bacterium]